MYICISCRHYFNLPCPTQSVHIPWVEGSSEGVHRILWRRSTFSHQVVGEVCAFFFCRRGGAIICRLNTWAITRYACVAFRFSWTTKLLILPTMHACMHGLKPQTPQKVGRSWWEWSGHLRDRIAYSLRTLNQGLLTWCTTCHVRHIRLCLGPHI